jgi:carboxypeptidase family protein/TonB-dependent receptor-like protein
MPALAAPEAATSTVAGTVVNQHNALPVVNAVVTLIHDGIQVASAKTDAFGNYTIQNVPPGVYEINVRAKGFAPSSTLNVVIGSGATVAVNAALVAAVDTSNVRSMGSVTVSANALASATAITQTINVQNVAQTGQIRFANQLATLPAINFGTSSSPGDDASVDIRGFGSSETASLLDGRPVGPLGVQAPDAFNYADTPIAALSNVDVTYGSGAQGLYGSDTVAGSINLHLINPTPAQHYAVQQQFGGVGILSSALDLTGTEGKVGYVFAGGVTGETGPLSGDIFQSARPELLAQGSVTPPFACSNVNGNDVSKCNQAVDTYPVGQQVKLSAELTKLRYALSSTTDFTISGYSAFQRANSTGNGDNDFLPYATRLGQIVTNPNGPDCVIGSGTINNGYTVVTNPLANPQTTACYTAQQWARASSGPDGGGAGRNRSTGMRDFDARITSKVGVNNISLDTYVNNYVYQKDSAASGGTANGFLLGTPVFADFYNTHGYLLADDIAGLKNDFGFGYALLNQSQTANQLISLNTNAVTGVNNLVFQPSFAGAAFREGSVFVRDNHTFSDRLSGFLNLWMKRSGVTDQTTFDPRVSMQYRPDAEDVLRLTYGHSDGPPAPELKQVGTLFIADPGNSLTSVTCAPHSNGIGSGGNPVLSAESSNDFELGYGHQFQDDSDIQVNAYVTRVTNELFGINVPLLQYGLNHVVFGGGALQNYLTHLIIQGCLPSGSTFAQTYPFFNISTTSNLANELARGVDLNGRLRFTPRFYADYGWSVEYTGQYNIPNSILLNNPTLLNGAQQNGFPLHQANVALDVQPGAFDVRLENYFVSLNNPLDRPAYYYSNLFISHPLNGGREIVTLGGTNIFNQAVQYYGLIGQGTPQNLNQFFPGVPNSGLGQNLAGISSNEEYGLQPAQLTLTLTARM